MGYFILTSSRENQLGLISFNNATIKTDLLPGEGFIQTIFYVLEGEIESWLK